MSTACACQPCRIAKTKCDLGRPSCGRCLERGVVCTGYSSPGRLVFRNENDVARKRSARGRGANTVSPITFDIQVDQPPISSSSVSEPSDRGFDKWRDISWLNNDALSSLPEPPGRTREIRAIERFFIDWTLHPTNDGVSLGYLNDLPTLYENAPINSVLNLAVRAMAFASVLPTRHYGIPFHVRARKNYGAALAQMRAVIKNEQELADDRNLAALLLIDNFELLFLSTYKPLGSHAGAVKHVLHTRGEEQLHSRRSFALWWVAERRLEARQILAREGPTQDQIECFQKLNMRRPDLRMASDLLQINALCARAKCLEKDFINSESEAIKEARTLIHLMDELIFSIEDRISMMSTDWKPSTLNTEKLFPAESMRNFQHKSRPPLPSKHILRYPDLLLAHIWSFHLAGQMVLRESLIATLHQLLRLEQRGVSDHEKGRIRKEKTSIEQLSTMIIESYPQLLGYFTQPMQPHNGVMIGTFWSLFPMKVVRQTTLASTEQKEMANRIISWVAEKYAIK